MKALSSHARPGAYDWLTPIPFVRALGEFDLDPCGFLDHPTAKRIVQFPEDGLACRWEGRVWLNPPYGDQCVKFVQRLIAHATIRTDGGGLLLCAPRTESVWFQQAAAAADLIFFLRERLHFIRRGESRGRRACHPQVLMAFGGENKKAILESGLEGVAVRSMTTPLRESVGDELRLATEEVE